MYLDFYGLKEKPFGKTPDPRFLYLSASHREALARLQYAVEERETAVLTGEIGCGKTTLSRALMDLCGSGYRFCFVFNPRLSPLELLRTIAACLEGDTPPTAKDDLLSFLTRSLYRCYEDGIHPVLVVDEAQMIEDDSLFHEVRLLTNFQLDDANLVSVILMGQPELRERLAAPPFEALRQRVGMKYHLQPLDLAETQEYLDFRLQVAGGQPGLFTPDAVCAVHALSRGVPRRINAIANNALLAGFGADASLITSALVAEVKGEIA